MTERKPSGMSFESWIDRQIREATERGEFDNLPGAGKPLPSLGKPNPEMWWIRQKLEREGLATDAALPTPLRLRREIDQLPDTVRDLKTEDDVRETVTELNTRIMEHLRAPSGPNVPVRLVDADQTVEQWRAERATTSELSSSAKTGPAVVQEPPVRRRRRWWSHPALRRRRRQP